MKKEIVKEAPSVEEAIDAALEELGVQQDVVEYEVESEPGKRLFGRPDKPARVRVWLKEKFARELEQESQGEEDAGEATDDETNEEAGDESGGSAAGREGSFDGPPPRDELTEEELDEVADAATESVKGILAGLGIEAEIEEYEGDEGEIILDVVGPDLGILIGRHGKTLDAIQTVVSATTHRKLQRRHPVLVDVEGYRVRRKTKLEEIAKRAADRACRLDREIKLNPMSSYERRIVHVTLRDDARVETASEGQDPYRQVVVTPA